MEVAMLGDMTYDEVLRLPRGTPVRLLNGHVGYITSWHHSTESVALRFDHADAHLVRAAELQRAHDGSLQQVAQDSPGLR